MVVKYIFSSVLITLYFFSLLLIPFDVYANKLGARVTAGFWGTEYKGYVTDSKSNEDSIDLKNDLELSNTVQSFFLIYLEQHISSIPNMRIGRSNIRANGNSILKRTFTYQGIEYFANSTINSTLNFDHLEASLYWKVINNDHRVDLGITVKDFNGQISISEPTSGYAYDSFDAAIPMIYVGYETDLPLTALTLGINSSFIGINRAYLYDIMAYVRYQTYSYVGVEFGYRRFQINISNDIILTDVRITGLYLNGFISF